jgi:two-component system chemotaxis response regulator CheB
MRRAALGRESRRRPRLPLPRRPRLLVEAQGVSVEAALWTAVEVLEERAELLRRVAGRRGDLPRTRRRLEDGAADALRRARLIRRALGSAPESADALGLEAAGGAE